MSPGNASCLAKRRRPLLRKLLPHFVRQATHLRVVECLRQQGVLAATLTLDLVVLAVDVPRVLGLHVDLQWHLHGEPFVVAPVVGAAAERGIEGLVGHFGPAQQLERALLARQRRAEQGFELCGGRRARPDPARMQPFELGVHGDALVLEEAPALVVDQPEFAARRREPEVGVVLAQREAVFRAAREHAVRLGRAARDEVVDHHADVGIAAGREPRFALLHLQARVDAGEQALRGGFFVAGGAVDLPCEIQSRDVLRLERGVQVARIEEVVLDRIAGPRDVRALEALDAAHERLLHVERQAGRNAVRVDLMRIEAFGLDEDLVRCLVGEAHDLVLDRGAIARADALDHAGEHRRAIGA